MSVIYQNVNFNSYSSTMPTCTYGKEYSEYFETNLSSIPASNYTSYNNFYQFLNAAMDGGNVHGFAIIVARNTDNGTKIFVNENPITLPAEIGEKVEGTLKEITMNSENSIDVEINDGGLR